MCLKFTLFLLLLEKLCPTVGGGTFIHRAPLLPVCLFSSTSKAPVFNFTKKLFYGTQWGHSDFLKVL